MSLKCAIQLQIPDIINRHGAQMLLSELMDALSINKERGHFVYRLMRILVHSGFFVKQSISTTGDDDDEEREGYMLAPASRLLLKEEPLSVRPFLLAMLDPIMMNPWQHMSQDPNLNQFFNEAMSSDARLVTSVVLKHCGNVFKSLNSIVDVGGGTGTVAKAVAEAFPDLSCICFDLPHVVNGLVGSKNLSFLGGDMFETIPKADAVLLKWILHDWSDEECIKILTRCKEAISSKENGGKLIIIDMVLKNGEGDKELLETQLFL
ncbi:hypothetical protein L2E82_40985 [Cichorium intybus]|uniref:Uncharacterized protein n=1 Tax=Cichorium intybus TaxID=13427 RepID=A0ACB9AMD9_CICIN|nr:hypothetical protein L2E82_40985 [Cichorium intybus]